MKPLLDITDVSLSYHDLTGETPALSHISFQLMPGEFLAIVGPSGCGKSTLLNLIAGFIKPSDGHIEIHGEDIANKSGKVGVVFQEHALMPWLTVKKNIMMGPSLHHKSKIVCEEIADKYIQMVGLKGMENYYPKQLSGGMAQRVGIARALANEPDIILMDEPLGALDAMTRENMRQEILKIWQKTRTTVFFITHSVQEAVYLADRVIVLKGGGVDCDVHIDIERPRNMKSEKFMEYIGFFEKKLSNGVVTSD